METYRKDKLIVKKFPSRKEMGQTAAAEAAAAIRECLKTKDQIRMIFAAAPSQNEFLEALSSDRSVEFNRITAFHMDEYAGLPADAPQGFGNFLKKRLFAKCPFREVHYLDGLAENPEDECRRYSKLLEKAPIDIVCMGIGENTHIAFNDPGVADFNDPKTVKLADLDLVCRQQQVNDGCFRHIDDVPVNALTLTVPCLFNCRKIFCMVPAKTKTEAVYNSLSMEISDKFPATILRRHADAVLYVDADSGARLNEVPGLRPIHPAEK